MGHVFLPRRGLALLFSARPLLLPYPYQWLAGLGAHCVPPRRPPRGRRGKKQGVASRRIARALVGPTGRREEALSPTHYHAYAAYTHALGICFCCAQLAAAGRGGAVRVRNKKMCGKEVSRARPGEGIGGLATPRPACMGCCAPPVPRDATVALPLPLARVSAAVKIFYFTGSPTGYVPILMPQQHVFYMFYSPSHQPRPEP